MATIYNWGMDGLGHAHICNERNEILFCMFDGGGQMGIWILESQEIDDITEGL